MTENILLICNILFKLRALCIKNKYNDHFIYFERHSKLFYTRM